MSHPISPRLPSPVLRFLGIEAASGALLLLASLVALLWANSPWASSYRWLWHTPWVIALPLGLGAPVVHLNLLFLVNEGLMTGFFLLVGLELRRELHAGLLADLKAASLPLLAALGGVLLPALIYLLCAPQARGGWAIPTTTDIAFAAGVLSLAAARAPLGLRRLLLTLAVADDIAALVIIALFYSGEIHPLGLLIALGGAVAQAALQRVRRGSIGTYVLAGIAIWFGLRYAGVHPTLAGVVLGLVTPVTASTAAPVAAQMEHTAHIEAALHPWVAWLIMPLFALANAGVELHGLPASDVQWQIAMGITAGLVLGKPVGIILASAMAVRAGLTTLPAGVRPAHVALLGGLGGIGFTMSMFLCNLAFTDAELLGTAKAAVVVASALAAAASVIAGRMLPGISAHSGAGKPPVEDER